MECTKIHPLHLPEIIASIGPFLSRGSLVTCFSVSKQWYHMLLPWLWVVTKFTVKGSPTLSSIQKNAKFVRALSIDYMSVLVLSNTPTTLPILTSLDIRRSVLGKPFDDPALVDFIKRHRETLISVTLARHTSEAVLAALEDCPRLESLKLENQDHVLDPREWIRQFEQLWSRLHTMSLKNDNYSTDPPRLETLTTMDWPLSNGPNRIENLNLSFNQPEAISGFSTWIVKQSPDIVRLNWFYVEEDAKSPMERLANIFEDDPTFGKKLEDITLSQVNYRNASFRFLMESLVQLHRLNLRATNFDQESWAILRTTKPAHLKTLTALDLSYCTELPAKAIHQMLCEMPSLRTFAARAVEDKEILEDPRPWVCLNMVMLTLRLSLTSFSTEPSVRTLAIQRYLAQVGQLKRLEVLTDFLPRYEQECLVVLEVESGLDALKDLRRLRSVSWVRACMGKNKVRWILENWPLLENPSRSRLLTRLDRGGFP